MVARRLERDHELAGIMRLVADACVVDYSASRSASGAVKSHVRNVSVEGERAVREWTTTSTSSAGVPIRSVGVCTLEHQVGEA